MKRIALLTITLALLAAPTANAALRDHHLSRSEARRYMAEGLDRQFATFKAGHAYRFKCVRRINKTRIRCMKIRWVAGDLSYGGTGSVWYTQESWGTVWNYSFRITRFDEYCAIMHGTDCVERFVVK